MELLRPAVDHRRQYTLLLDTYRKRAKTDEPARELSRQILVSTDTYPKTPRDDENEISFDSRTFS